VSRRRTLATRDDGSLRVVAVADTHGHPHAKCGDWIRELAPDVILHGGDIGDLRILDDLAAIAPVIAVRGNIDVRAHDLPDDVVIDIVRGQEKAVTILLTHIAVYGPKLRADAARLARQLGATMVVCGHSHVPFIGGDRGITVINAGSVGPRRFHLPIVFGLIDVSPAGISPCHIDCETGQRWSPPEV
jgi:putative phosphoesterase